MLYRCIWAIDVDADNPEDAARIAERLMTQRLESCWEVQPEWAIRRGKDQQSYTGRMPDAYLNSTKIEIEVEPFIGTKRRDPL